MPVSFGVLEGLDYRRLAGALGEGPLILGDGPLIREAYGGLRVPNQRVLSRHPSKGRPIGLSSWHAKIVSANQDLVCRSLYRSSLRRLAALNGEVMPRWGTSQFHFVASRTPSHYP